MLRICFVLLMLLCVHWKAIAQIITIKDKENYQPLELVTLSSETPKASALTNSKGQVDISAFEGADSIIVRIIGYRLLTTSYATLKEGDFIVYMEPSSINLDQMVVSATRWNQQGREIPSKVTTISPKDVTLQNPQTAADLLGTSGEVFIQKSQQGGGSPMIRGFATNRLLISVDGIRMNNAIFRGGNIQNVISLDPFATEHTEVFFGPGSVIYGSDAIGGVMSFQTLTPHLATDDKTLLGGKALTRYSSANNERTGHIDLNVGWQKWAMVTSISYYDYDDLKMGTYGPDEYLRPFYVGRLDSTDVVITNGDDKVQRPSAYEQVNLMQKFRYRPNEHWDLTYGFHYSSTSNNPRYDRHIQLRDGLPRSAEWYYGPQLWMMNSINLKHHKTTALYDEMSLRLSYQLFEESRIDRDFNGATINLRQEEVDAYSGNLDLVKTIAPKHKLFYGFEAVYNDVASKGEDVNINTNIAIPAASRYPDATWASYAAYASYQFKASEKVLLQLGSRYNQFDLQADFDTSFFAFPFTEANINNGSVSGSAGIVYTPSDKWTISANAASGFRAPNVDDVGKVFDSEPGALVIPNPDLRAERAYNVEAGIAKIFGESVKFDLTGYYTILEDALVRRNFTLNGQDSVIYEDELSQVQAIQNAAVANVYGIQTGIEVKLASGFGVSSRFNYQEGEEELDDGTKSPSRHAAPWFGLTRLTYSAQKLKLDLNAIYNGEVSFANLAIEERGKQHIYATDSDGNPHSPGWYTLNFKAMYQLTDLLTISSGIENITDQRYRPYSSGLAGAGRNFIMALKASF